MFDAASNIPYPSWLNPADNTWQIVAATLVGLMSLPGIAVLYGGLVRKKWIVNTMLMTFSAFSLTLVVWMLWGYNMAFGPLSHFGPTGSFWSGFVGHFTPLATACVRAGPGRLGGQHAHPLPLPDGDPRLLPVRLRRHHADPVPGGARRTASSSRRGC